MDPKFGGPAFSESQLVKEMQKTQDISLWVRAGNLDQDFLQAQKIKNTYTYSFKDTFFAFLAGKNALAHAVKQSDILHLNGHWSFQNILWAALARRYQKPYLVHPRGMCWVGHRKVLRKRVFNFIFGKKYIQRAKKIIVLSQYETAQLKPYGIASQQIEVLPNGIEGFYFGGNLSGQSFPKDFFLYLGRLEARKNIGFLIEAFSDFSKKRNTVQLFLVGPNEGAYQKTLQAKIENLGLSEKVFILPPAYGVLKQELFKKALALIYPSIEEPFGRVPFEALLEGCPPILPKQSGAAEYLAKFFPEAIYDQDQKTSLTQAMEAVYNQKSYPALQNKIKDAKAWVTLELSWSQIAKRLLSIYESVLQNQRQNRQSAMPKLSANG